jgi:tryptophanyl-tRNA synthetase
MSSPSAPAKEPIKPTNKSTDKSNDKFTDKSTAKPTVLSGMRSTGDLHLGHYFGVITNWLKLQDQYPGQCFVFAADWHALTTDYKNPEVIRAARRSNVIDWLAAGLDPDRCTIYVQSQIREVAELHLLFSMITPLGWLERNPTYKDQIQNLSGAGSGPAGDGAGHDAGEPTGKDTSSLGFLAYPVLQAADIAIVRGSLVPVGEDQVPHLELNREMIRRFKHLYKKSVFPEPRPLLTETPKLLGTDNRKMSKSYGNAIGLADDSATVAKRVKSMITDPARVRRDDPGHPEICNVFSYQKLLTPLVGPEGASGAPALDVATIEGDCRAGRLSCGDCKGNLAAKLARILEPMHERRQGLTKNPKVVDDILAAGAARVRSVAQDVLSQTREVMKI